MNLRNLLPSKRDNAAAPPVADWPNASSLDQPLATGEPAHPFAAKSKRQTSTLITYVLIGLIILGAAIGGYLYLNSLKGTVLITDLQPDYEVHINNATHPVKSDRITLTIAPGTYRVTVKRPNYEAYTQDIVLKKQQKITIRPIFTLADKRSEDKRVASVDYAQVSQDREYIYFLGDNRRFLYRLTIDNQKQDILTSKPLNQVTDIQWSGSPDLALITQRDGVYLHEIPRYDYHTQEVVKIAGTDVVSPVWDPTMSSRLAFAYYPPSGEKSLVFSDKRLIQLDRKADLKELPPVKVRWSPDASYVLLIGNSTKSSDNYIWVYTTANGSLRKLSEQNNVFDVAFSPDGKTVLAQVGSGSGAQLTAVSLTDGKGVLTQPIASTLTNVTWIDSEHLFVAEVGKNQIAVMGLDGSVKSLPYQYPTQDQIQGLFYFPNKNNLIYYTKNGIYTSFVRP